MQDNAERLAKQAANLNSLMVELRNNNQHRLSLASAMSESKLQSPSRRGSRHEEVDDAVKRLKSELKTVKKKCVAQVQECIGLVDELAEKQKIEEELRKTLEVEKTVSAERLSDLRRLQYDLSHRQDDTQIAHLVEEKSALLQNLSKLQREFTELSTNNGEQTKSFEAALAQQIRSSDIKLAAAAKNFQDRLETQQNIAQKKLTEASIVHEDLRQAAEKRDKKRLTDIMSLKSHIETLKKNLFAEQRNSISLKSDLEHLHRSSMSMAQSDTSGYMTQIKELNKQILEEQLKTANSEQATKLVQIKLDDVMYSTRTTENGGEGVTIKSLLERAEAAEGEASRLRELQAELLFHTEQSELAFRKASGRVKELESTLDILKHEAVTGKRASMAFQNGLEKQTVELTAYSEGLSRSEATLEREQLSNATLKEDKARLLTDIRKLATELGHAHNTAHYQNTRIEALTAENERLVGIVTQFQEWASGVVMANEEKIK